MKKNILIIGLIFIIPIIAYMGLTQSGTTTAKEALAGRPQILKFTSAMCLDCQTMNKVFKEIFPQFQNKITLTEINVQDKNKYTQEQIAKYNVTLVPTIILLNSQGVQVQRIEGAIPKARMEKYLKDLK